jgi:hypothetical protein
MDKHVKRIRALLADLKKARKQIEKIEAAFGDLQFETTGKLRGFCEEVNGDIGNAFSALLEAASRGEELEEDDS